MIRLAPDGEGYETDLLNGRVQVVPRLSRVLEHRFPMPDSEHVRGLMAVGADRGTKVHAGLDLDCQGDLHWVCSDVCGYCGNQAKGTELGDYIAAYRGFDPGLEVLIHERCYLGQPHMGFAYGTTIDRIHKWPMGTISLDDFKTKAKADPNLRKREIERHVLQLSGQYFAVRQSADAPRITAFRILQVTPREVIPFDLTSEVLGGGVEEWVKLSREYASSTAAAASAA